ncbi:hypothetical protein VIN7_9007 [Saccharomyces cerevisiae x Saccharomyces kudriavzevii VIN7]|uniref:Uncharacterized protein n=1 Tax=Saccharomyces cerevisiae x Saccharomyces kudriavzevii (strain VIN7) TaxID=1095631 RepID=H0GYZ3_SACCK|nr:hypothetical protein VIN7_9007 [Saccharomyces cerevisiae x Saccharomyces kudriavzevii VIN7]
MSWKLMIDVGKTDSAGWFCGNVIYKHETDGRSYIYSIYKYAKREMGCDMSDNSDLKERVVDAVRRDFANNKIGSCVTILEPERVVAYAKVLMPQFREITLNDLLCEAVKGWKVPN